MKKKIYRKVYLILGMIGMLGIKSLKNFMYFTTLSNLFCIIVVLLELIKNTNFSELKFVTLTYIMFTFIVFNFIIMPKENYSYNFTSMLFHIVLPIMYFIDFIIYSAKTSKKYILISLIFPFLYFIIIYILNLCPYFFFTVNVFKWFIKLLILFLLEVCFLYITKLVFLKKL